MRRTPIRRRSSRTDPEVAAALFERAKGRCELGFSDCERKARHPHHRKLRSQGGEDTLENLIAVCFACHIRVHAHPGVSYEAGWLVHSYNDPAEVPWW